MSPGIVLNRLFTYLYSACVASMLVFATHTQAADIMSDQRLFFSDKQRLLLDRTTAEEANAAATDASNIIGPSKPGHQPLTQRGQTIPAKGVSTQDQQAPATVQFNGLVTGKRRIQVLINGKPCVPVSSTELYRAEAPKLIRCPHLKLLPFSLLLHVRTGQIIVRTDTVTVATLDQGDKF